jgi:hypothetical protein
VDLQDKDESGWFGAKVQGKVGGKGLFTITQDQLSRNIHTYSKA